MENFLSTEEHQRVLDFALAGEDGFGDSGVIDQHGRDQKDYGFRKSRTLSGSPLDAIWPLFDHRLRGILAYVRKELGVRWFPLGEVERQLTAHSGGGFFAPHVDTGHSLTVSRRISCVYYFHSSPRRFTGGELKLYDSWVTDGGSTAAPTCTTLTPIDNSIVFFPSDEFHEVCPVHLETEAFRDSRFAITIWFREGQMPAAACGCRGPIMTIHIPGCFSFIQHYVGSSMQPVRMVAFNEINCNLFHAVDTVDVTLVHNRAEHFRGR